ncbi:DUF2007 domain-containing protein [Kallotenue papyrolyticum]|uniref:putative signal transducing protein n=1 Tax=Kallotenue papyrolyticum TaxID=1325125 RepID=UPI0004785C3E|nr:DUF2007 domain-containing protein [Kallotenue papyrolyticum]
MDAVLRWRRFAQRPGAPGARPTGGETTARFGGDGQHAPVRIAVVDGPLASGMARAALEAADIPVLIKQDSAGVIYGLTVGALAAAEIWVPAALAERARSVLIGIGLLDETP